MHERILIVEDDFLIRATLTESLTDDGFEVEAAETGEQALEVLRAGPGIALLMTDLQLGAGMNGRTLAAAARGLQPDLPIIFMTGLPDPDDVAGPNERVIVKPYEPSALANAARELLARRAGA